MKPRLEDDYSFCFIISFMEDFVVFIEEFYDYDYYIT